MANTGEKKKTVSMEAKKLVMDEVTVSTDILRLESSVAISPVRRFRIRPENIDKGCIKDQRRKGVTSRGRILPSHGCSNNAV